MIQAKAIHFLRPIFLKHIYTGHLFKIVFVAKDPYTFKFIAQLCSKS